MKTIDIELTEKLSNLVGKHLISSTSTTVSTKDAINIYEIRSQLPSAKNGLVKGYKNLLQQLQTFDRESIMIHNVISLGGVRSIIFTNSKIDKSLGELVFTSADDKN
jgi:hypothetical protein